MDIAKFIPHGGVRAQPPRRLALLKVGRLGSFDPPVMTFVILEALFRGRHTVSLRYRHPRVAERVGPPFGFLGGQYATMPDSVH